MKIETGKYYRTADGTKVGPMIVWRGGEGCAHPWMVGTDPRNAVTEDFSRFGDLWRSDGTSVYVGPNGYLVEEWVVTPKTWGDMTDEEKGVLLLAEYDGDGSEFNPPEPISLDWSVIKPEYKWASVDKNGIAYVYERKPILTTSWWSSGAYRPDEAAVNCLSSFKRGTVEWDKSLIKRPE